MAQMTKKWEGKTSEKVKGVGAEQVWSLLVNDFFGLSKWFPTLSVCIPVHGVSGEPGCIRYCAGFTTPVDPKTNGHDHAARKINWTYQKLVSVDKENMTYAYSIVDGNSGFQNYVSTLKLTAEDGGACGVEWWYEVEPVEGWRLEDLDLFLGSGLRVMARRIEEAFSTMKLATCTTTSE